MDGFCIELTNACSRQCLHCFRNKKDPQEFLPLTLAREVLPQARALGFRTVCLTGGEVSLYPDLKEFLSLLVDHGFSFTLVTNGYRFRENLLPLLSVPKNRENLSAVCFSLDGADADTHDALRGPGSFREVMEGASLCQLANLPLCFKSVVTNFNKGELTEIALLGAGFDPLDHGFIHPFPSPRMIETGIIPSPDELRNIMDWIAGSLKKALRPKIIIEGYGPRTTLFECPNILKNTTMDFQGNLVLCCNLSHVTREEGEASVFGREWLGNLNDMSLREGLIQHYHGVAGLMEARLRDMEGLDDLTFIPCYWCLQHFDKLDWLRDFPESPWFNGVREEKRSNAGV
jgi:MoaA/NifB/PqqE/SkfB family radical SAM enzyme